MLHQDATEENQRMRWLLDSMSSFLIEVDADLLVSRWNLAAEATFGIASAQAVGKPLGDCGIHWDLSGSQENLANWLTIDRPSRIPELPFVRVDGSDGVLGITINPLKDSCGAPAGFFLMGADITARIQLETQLAQAQKLESVGRLAAGIAHEINTPMQYVGDNTRFAQEAFANFGKMFAKYQELLQAAKTGAALPAIIRDVEEIAEACELNYFLEEVPQAITQSLQGIERIATIVHAMKEFSHPGTGQKTATDVNRALESTIAVARNEWKYVAEVITDFDDYLTLVPCIADELNQVFLNILVNAAHAIAESAEKDPAEKGKIVIATRQTEDWAEITISDTGAGIPDAIRTRIFDPFFTTKPVGKGTGQGLAIAHNVIVEKHKGTLTVESEAGKGTRFIIRLPMTPAVPERDDVT